MGAPKKGGWVGSTLSAGLQLSHCSKRIQSSVGQKTMWWFLLAFVVGLGLWEPLRMLQPPAPPRCRCRAPR